MEWKVEEMKLINEKSVRFNTRERIFNCEETTSTEEKIAFIDKFQDGKLSYLLSLINKFNNDKKDLIKKDERGYVKTVSLVAWLKRNDTLNIFKTYYNIGRMQFMGCERHIEWINSKSLYDVHEELIDELFHRQLKELEKRERQYFLDHDEYSILKTEFRNKNHNTTFGVHISDCSNGELYICNEYKNFEYRKKRPITIDELKELLSKYEQLDKFVLELTSNTNIKY